MAITLSTGAVVAIASAYGSAITTTSVTNSAAGANAVVTAAAHGLTTGDYVEVTSGWGMINARIARVANATTNTFELEGFDTSNSTKFPAGQGVGSVRKVSAWSNLSQVKSIGVSGGSMSYADITAIDDVVAKQVPTTRAAVSVDIEVFDDPSLAWYAPVIAATDAKTPYGLRITFPNGSKLLANSYWSMQKTPAVQVNQALTAQISLTYAAEPIRYAS